LKIGGAQRLLRPVFFVHLSPLHSEKIRRLNGSVNVFRGGAKQNPMHILINGWFAGQEGAGSGQYLHHLLEHLPRTAPDHRYTLLVPPAAAERLDAEGRTWPGVDILSRRPPPLPRQLAKLWWEQATMPRAARRLGADVLWTPYWAAPYWQPRPVAVTVHDLIPLLLPAYGSGTMQRLYTRLVSATARRSAAVITVSQASARDIVTHLHIPAERVHVVYHGPNQEGDVRLDAKLLDTVRERYDLPKRYFLYLGGFDVRKNVTGVLQAYRRYLDRDGDPTVRLVIAGKLPENDSDFAPDPRKKAAEMNLIRQVHFCGWVAEADKPALYHMATAYLFPSFYEGFGMMLLEAMQAGTPVITSE
jgi:glycosyltransferase involved in cell wall biosynthesis